MTLGLLALFCVLVAGGALAVSACRFGRRGQGELRQGEERLLAAFYETVLAPAGWESGRIMPPVLAEVAETVATLPRNVRRLLLLGLWVFDQMPRLLLVSARSFSALAPEGRAHVLERAGRRGGFALGSLCEGIELLALIPLAARPEVQQLARVDRWRRPGGPCG